MKKTEFLKEDMWLSSVLKRPSYSLTLTSQLLERLVDFNSRDAIKLREVLSIGNIFIYSKTSMINLEITDFLEDLGFRIIDTNITFEKQKSPKSNLNIDNSIRFAVSRDKDAVVKIAKSSFSYSRFHLDNRIKNSLASEIKAQWAGNFFVGTRGDQMIISHIGNVVTGFTQLIEKGDKVIIDLIAVGKEFYRRHIAQDMIKFVEYSYPNVSLISVTTQVSNIPSMRLYEKSDFYSKENCYVFHYHGNE